MPLQFTPSPRLSIGVELELQLVNTQNFNLAPDADDLLRRLRLADVPGGLKPEITQSMIEINSSVHETHSTLLSELEAVRALLSSEARKMNVAIAGGGTHPFQKWSERRIYPTERFLSVHEKYGFLAKQFTVFGQHIHVGVANGDDALYLCHAFARYLPHFIALSASSPFYQGADTAFDSSRLSVINAFPLSGTPPPVATWDEFDRYFDKMEAFGIVKSMKDFYWDIRPKPEFGTIEIRVCDTPLTVEKAADLAAYAQALVRLLLQRSSRHIDFDIYLTYNYNRFQACRFGFGGELIDPSNAQSLSIREDVRATIAQLVTDTTNSDVAPALDRLLQGAMAAQNDAHWLRETFKRTGTLNDVVRLQAERWMTQ